MIYKGELPIFVGLEGLAVSIIQITCILTPHMPLSVNNHVGVLASCASHLSLGSGRD